MQNTMPAKRIQTMGTSIFSTMSKLAVEYNAVNLGQGFPDFDGPLRIMQDAFDAMKQGKNQYAPMPGILSLRKEIENIYIKYYSLDFNPDTEITITAGATEALFCAILGLIDDGDEVIMFEPFYDSHQADVILSGGIPKYVTLKKPNFKFDFDELESTITNKTKILILNNPHNPTGKVYNLDELKIISELAIKHNLIVLSDEVYEFITFDKIRHTPIAALPGMKERTIIISSTGKTFSMTGWKIGYAVAPEKYIDSIRKVHQWATFAVNTPAQHAMAQAFTRIDEYLPEFQKMYEAKRDLIYSKLKQTVFTPHKPDGSYFIMADIPEKVQSDDVTFAIDLIKNFGIATIPPSVFYGKSDEGKTMLRLCFAKKDETIIEGIERLSKFT